MEQRILSFLLLTLIITETQQQQHHHNQQNVADLEQGSGHSFSGEGGLDEDDDKVTQSTRTEGSGGPIFGHDSDDNDDMGLTPCQRERFRSGSGATSTGAFRPQCTIDGKFKPTQCDSKKCWCVDKDGVKMPGTETTLPSKPKCSSRSTDFIARTRSPPAAAVPEVEAEGHITDDITIDEQMHSEKSITFKMQSTTSHEMDQDPSDDGVEAKQPEFFTFLLKDPLIFAGIVGGIVLALLCIVLLIMFTIYRMRKKDEGSYALDEPKKSYGFAYTRANDKEFFA